MLSPIVRYLSNVTIYRMLRCTSTFRVRQTRTGTVPRLGARARPRSRKRRRAAKGRRALTPRRRLDRREASLPHACARAAPSVHLVERLGGRPADEHVAARHRPAAELELTEVVSHVRCGELVRLLRSRPVMEDAD